MIGPSPSTTHYLVPRVTSKIEGTGHGSPRGDLPGLPRFALSSLFHLPIQELEAR
jgi:hypothetical protein